MIPRPLHLLARRVRQLVDPGVPILLYHRVTRLSSDPFEIAVSPERFAEDLEWIRRYAHPLPLAQVCDALAGRKLPRGTAAVTFDDGYVDVLDEARPLLERFDVPATVFVVSAILGQTSELWWDELDQIVFSPTLPADGVVFSGPGGGTSFDTRQPRGVLFHALYDFLFRLLPHERESAMDLLRQWAGHKPHLRPTHRGLTPDELIRLADGGLVEIGATGHFGRQASIGGNLGPFR